MKSTLKKENLNECYLSLPSNGRVLDVGSLGFNQHTLGERLRPNELQYFGIDYCQPEHIPTGVIFKKADLNQDPIPFADDTFDLVVAKHIIEHLKDPVKFFGECLRVCKPGGLLYLEAPSERSLALSGMPFQHHLFYSLSFFDDPTHMSRPWSPQALFRLTKLYSCNPLNVRYMTSWKHRLAFPFTYVLAHLTKNGKLLEKSVWNTIGWASSLVAEKPTTLKGHPPFNYYVPPR